MVFPSDENVLVGLKRADDAGVYKISDDLALIQTVDFFTPIVEDPYWFGQIAAANALSDVYAMGGIPKTAMNLVAFPSKEMDLSILRSIIQGGIDKMVEAEVVLLGGHSIEDKEIKYGLSVTGLIHPSRVLVKNHLRSSDSLVLTKPIGTGVLTTAAKAGMVSDDLYQKTVRSMAELNRTAAQVMDGFDVSACTDVTGFGLMGHLAEMVVGSGHCANVFSDHVPVIHEALEFANMGFVPTAAYNNRSFRESMINISDDIPRFMQDIFFDPQTSGGLLIVVKGSQAKDLVKSLQDNGVTEAAWIGNITDEADDKINVIR